MWFDYLEYVELDSKGSVCCMKEREPVSQDIVGLKNLASRTEIVKVESFIFIPSQLILKTLGF